MRHLDIFETADFTEAATKAIVESIKAKPSGQSFNLFLSGGSTPIPIYEGLGRSGIDWSHVHLWWGDERFVPMDHADSNYRLVKESLLDHIDIPVNQVHPWPILSTPELSAETYEREFKSFFDSSDHDIDFQLLGLGDDGHTASLFPGTKALTETVRFCVSNHVEEKGTDRLTLTYPALGMSQRVVFLIKGEGKAQAVQELLEKEMHPGAKVAGQQSTELWLDTEAASKLSPLK